MNTKVTEIFPHWIDRLSKVEPTESQPTEAWKNIESLRSAYGTELAYAMLKCHEAEEQVEIVKNEHNACSLYEECPLAEINIDESNEFLKEYTLGRYLSESITEYFIDQYFYSDSSKLGLNILARMRFDQTINPKDHPVQLLAASLLEYDRQSPLIEKPDFEKRERRDSIASSSSKRNSHGRKPS
jgi:hypothetical protein